MSGPRTIVIVAAAALLAAVLPAGAQETTDVEVVDVDFMPNEATIDPGGTVTWTQTGTLPHTVTADDGSFDSHPDCSAGDGCMTSGDTFAQAFDEPGEYPYYCKVHGGPGGEGMSGVVVVTAAAQTEAPTEAPTAEPTEESTEDDTVAATGSISVEDQSGDGTTVAVTSVTIEGADGWVVVHLDDDGGPGAVLGQVAVAEGTSTDVQVPLDERLASDATVWPMLHVDAGTPGTYEFPGADTPVTVDGSVVMAPLAFTVTDAQPVEEDLPATGVPLTAVVALAGLVVAGGSLLVRRTREDRP